MTDGPTPEERRKLQALVRAAPQSTRRVEVTNMADVKMRRALFLWWPYLPLGQVVIVAGAPGHGKSQLAAMIASLASRGELIGDVTEPSRVLMMCAEDDLATTVAPRLMAVNADMRLIDSINVVTDFPGGLTSTGMIKLPGDYESVQAWASRHLNARLVVMDPVASFFDRSHSTLINQDVRDAFDPMVAIAQTYGVTIVIVLHLNKSESRDFASRIAESHGFQALARSVLALGPDPDDRDGARGSRKIIAVTKANLVKPGAYGIRCEVRSVTLTHTDPPIETSTLALLGKCEISADDLLMPSAERSERIGAVEWLTDFVGDRWVKVGEVRKAAISDGLSWRTISRARTGGGFQSAKQPGVEHGPWWIAARGTPALIHQTGVVGADGSVEGPQGGQGGQGRPSGGSVDTASLGNGKDLDAYRELRDRQLGERDDELPWP